jgi:IS4 transposase
MKDNAVYQSIDDIDLPDDKDQEIIKDETITLEYTANGNKETIKLRRVVLWDDTKSKVMVFLTNSFDQEAATIAGIYKYRRQIELLFKKLKQNFPLKYFPGDNQNAIEIQILCSLICLLLMEVVRKTIKRKRAFSNMVALVRFHMVSYVHLINFLNDPEKELKESIKNQVQTSLFPT